MGTRFNAVVARRCHECTSCGAGIGRGDNYHYASTPPWKLGEWGEGRWLVEKVCYACSGAAA